MIAMTHTTPRYLARNGTCALTDGREITKALDLLIEMGQPAAIDNQTPVLNTAAQIMFRDPKSYLRKWDLAHRDVLQLQALTGLSAPWGGFTFEDPAMRITAHASMFCTLTKNPADNKQRLANATLAQDLRDCAETGVMGTVVHPGAWHSSMDSANAAHNVASTLRKAGPEVWNARRKPMLLLENHASGKSLHASLQILAQTIEAAVHLLSDFDPIDAAAHVGICFDTAHAYAAGIDWTNPVYFAELIEPYIHMIKAVHFNNPRHPLGSNRDGHDRLENGCINMLYMSQGYTMLRKLLGPEVPFIVESTDLPVEIMAMHSWQNDIVEL
jgi:endonuclease IV